MFLGNIIPITNKIETKANSSDQISIYEKISTPLCIFH